MNTPSTLALLGAAMLSGGAALAEDNFVKVSASYYGIYSSTNGISGIGVPPGADVDVRGSATAIFTYERLLTPNVGLELVIGIPPKATADATGSVAFLGNNVFSAKAVSPTVLLNYHFGNPGDTWRPYLGAGINYTKFIDIKSSLNSSVQMSDSLGWAAQAGIAYAVSRQVGLYASIGAAGVKSDIVSSGSTVLTTTVDFRPIVYSIGLSYAF